MDEEKGKSEFTSEKMMLELFKTEIERQIRILSEGLLSFQHDKDLKLLEPLMRSAHSIKGAAKVFSFDPIVQLAHAMEGCFIAAQEGEIILNDYRLELLFEALDVLGGLVNVPLSEIALKISSEQNNLAQLKEKIALFTSAGETIAKISPLKVMDQVKEISEAKKEFSLEMQDRVLRLTAQNINRLMGLAAESMVETRWLRPFFDSLHHLKLNFNQIFILIDNLKSSLGSNLLNEVIKAHFFSLGDTLLDFQRDYSDRLVDLEMFIARHSHLSDRFYSEVIESRMRPFADAVEAFPRMVWVTARQLKKKARLEIHGKSTLIDREILEKLEVPLGHLLRNAIDHGIGTPEERIAVGKLPEGVIRLEASHKAGMLNILVSDDGRGINIEVLKNKIVKDHLLSEDDVSKLSEQELLNFLLLPKFSTAEKVTDLSGRGIGLNIVKNLLKEVSGSIHIENRPGKGMSFLLKLPLTLSVMRALITRIGKGIFAFPLADIEQTITISRNQVEEIENQKFFFHLGTNIGLIPASQVLNLGGLESFSSTLPIVILRKSSNYYGIIVDEFIEEKELVIQETESRLGKIPCISSGSVMENGDPVLIIDIEKMIEAIEKLV